MNDFDQNLLLSETPCEDTTRETPHAGESLDWELPAREQNPAATGSQNADEMAGIACGLDPDCPSCE